MAACACLFAANQYNGPRPPKQDIPYLVHANHLVETEVSEAREQGGKKDTTYIIPGTSSPAKTPLAEPIFIIDTSQLSPEQIELYRLDVKGDGREVSISPRHRHEQVGPFHLIVTRLDDHLYKIEADEPLQNGEYSLSPNGSNKVFCFQIY